MFKGKYRIKVDECELFCAQYKSPHQGLNNFIKMYTKNAPIIMKPMLYLVLPLQWCVTLLDVKEWYGINWCLDGDHSFGVNLSGGTTWHKKDTEAMEMIKIHKAQMQKEVDKFETVIYESK